MIKQISNLFAVSFLSLSTFAADPNLQHKSDGAQPPCSQCEAAKASKQISLAQEFAKQYIQNIAKPFPKCDNQEGPGCLLINWMKWKNADYAKNCKGFFMNEDGTIGSFSQMTGKLMFDDVLDNGEKSVFLQDNPMFEKYCPGFNQFSIDQKIAFHGWIFELTAFPENVCSNKNSVVPGVDSAAACMFQLNYPRSARSWRGSGLKVNHCDISEKALLTDAGCIGCSFDIYKKKTMKDGTPLGLIDKDGTKTSGSYWASQTPISEAQEKCLESTFQTVKMGGKEVKQPRKITVKVKGVTKTQYEFISKCAYLNKKVNPNNEWLARYKFFKRIQRFPLCKTEFAKKEIADLEQYQKTKK